MCLHVRIMKNILSLHCYHQPVIFQTPVPEVEIIWNTQQRIFKHTHTHESVSAQACEQTTREKTFPGDERKIGSCHFPSKRQKYPSIFL